MHDGTHTTRAGSATADGRDGGAYLIAGVFAGKEALRRGIEGLLRSIPDARVVHGRGTPDEVGTVLSQRLRDLAVGTLTDSAWPDERSTARTGPSETTLLVVDRAAPEALPARAERPATAYLWQLFPTGESVGEALRQIGHGDAPMVPANLSPVVARPGPGAMPGRPGAIRLTGREREALALLVEGLSNKQIARQLSISSHGAKRLVTSIMLKLDAPNRTQAAVTAVRAGLLDGA